MKFYSAWYCPFAQRAWMTLLLKEIDFDYIEVDPYRRSDWWLTISRGTAKVPVIISPGSNADDEVTIVDSTRVVEFLEELEPRNNPLLPKDPRARAEIRYWIDQINSAVVPYFYRFLQAREPGSARDEAREHLLGGIEALTSAMATKGPYFDGEQMGIIDLLMIPFAYRIELLLGHYRDFSLPTLGDNWPIYQRWYQAMLAQPVFKATATEHADYDRRLIDFYHPYSLGEGQKDVAKIP